MASASGSLLFYTDGGTIWDQTNSVMANGSGLNGALGVSGTQRALIIQKPGSSTIYYVFTIQNITNTGSTNGLFYSEVDMSLASGNGSVTAKNVPVSTVIASYNSNTDIPSKITATRHCNGTDIWVVSRDLLNWNWGGTSTSGTFNNSFRSFLVTATGVNTTAIVSSPTTYSYSSSSWYTNDFGGMKISPNGKKLAVALYYNSYYTSNYADFELFDFDNTSGVVSNSLALSTTGANNTYNYARGVEFSPDGSKLYGTQYNNAGYSGGIFQWDLCASSPTAIAASMYTVTSGSNISNYYFGAAQLAPDGKIYITRNYSSTQYSLDVINSPNSSGSACSYTPLAQSTGTTGTAWSNYNYDLPNFMNSYMPQHPPTTPFTHTVSSLYGCQTASFNSVYIPGVTTVGCASTGYGLIGMLWDFGDPATGAANTSTLQNPYHAYSTLGTYTAQLILYYSCGGGTDTIRSPVNVNTPCISITSTSITCASLGSATVIPLGGIGPFSYTWMPTAQAGSVATGLSPGTYTLTVYDPGNNLTYTTTTTFNSLIPLTGNLAYSNSTPCNGAATGTAQVTNIAGGSGSQSYLWSNGVNSYTAPSPNTLSAGIWSLTVTDNLTGCAINNVFFINQPTPIVAMPSSNTFSVCLGGSVALTATASGGVPALTGPDYSYSWSPGSAGNMQTVSPAVAGTHIYTLSAVDSLGCSGSQTISLNVVSHPIVSVNTISICPLQTGTLTASGAATYTWNNGTTTNTFTDSPATSQQYTVIGEALGCSTTTVAEIYLLPAPIPTVSSNSPVCEGAALTFSAGGGTAYAWNGPNAFVSALPATTINGVPVNATGVYSVLVTAANSCTATGLQTAVINPLPTLTLSPSNSSICANTTSVVLSAVGTATLFDWQPLQGLYPNSPAISTAAPAATQVYSLTGSLNSCTTMVTATVTVVPPPMPVASLSSPSTCAEAFNGSPNTITLTAGGAASYTITTPNDIYNSNPSGPITNLNTLPPHIPGVSTATVYGSNGVCTVSTSAEFSIIPNPTVSVSNPTPVICAGDNFTYTSNGADSYVWSAGTPGQTLYTTGNVAVTNPSINAIFSVFGGSLGCNSPIQSSTITVNPLPQVSVEPNPALTCLNSSVTLTASGNGTLYNWQPPYWLNTDQGATVSASPPAQQVYTVIASLNSCTASALATVSVLPLPSLTVSSSASDVLCIGQSFTLFAGGANSFSWLYPNRISKTGPAIQVNPVNLLYSGNYTVTGTGANGCRNTATIAVNMEDNPNGYLQSSALQGCVPLCGNYQFVATNQQSVTVTGWQINGQALAAQNVFQKCFTMAGNYTVEGHLISAHGCANTVTFAIIAYPQPKAEFTFTPEHPVENFETVSFTPYRDSTITQFNWSFASNDAKNQSSSIYPGYLFETAGTYPVALVVRNQWNCADSVVKTIRVEPDFAVYVPNAFTPNDDTRNEIFLPVTRGVKSLSFMIFDRWGETIFSTGSLNTGWDGTYKGQPCKQDLYVWKVTVSGNNGQEKKLTGTVLLLR